MKKILVILVFLSYVLSFGQINDKIYRIEGKSESPGIATYDVGILILSEDGSYKLTSQEYSTKKMMKKNIILNLNVGFGRWRIKNDKLILKGDKKNRDMIFIFRGENKISPLIDGKDTLRVSWKRIM